MKKQKTIINTYDKECNDPTGIHVTAEISGSGEKAITDEDGVTPTEEDKTTDKSSNSVTMPPKFELGESPEEFSAEMEAWSQYLLEGALLKSDDLLKDITGIINIE